MMVKQVVQGTWDQFLKAVEKYGVGMTMAFVVLWFMRTDLILPMVESHKAFLQDVSQSQKEISISIKDMTQVVDRNADTVQELATTLRVTHDLEIARYRSDQKKYDEKHAATAAPEEDCPTARE